VSSNANRIGRYDNTTGRPSLGAGARVAGHYLSL
jgi:hypothetical protein